MANIQKYLDDIKKALFGREVRGSIHDAIEAINKETEGTTNKQEQLDATFKQLIINAGQSNAEVVAARVDANGTPYATLGDRLNSIDNNINTTNKEVIEARTDKYGTVHNDLKTRLHDIDSQIENKTHYVNAKKYKHLVIGSDWTDAIQTALRENSKVIISEDIEIHGTVEINSNKVIELGSCRITKPDTVPNTDPIFWINGNGGTIKGQGQSSSIIMSNVASPDGVVKIGHKSQIEATSNVNYCQVSDVQISGVNRLDGQSVVLYLLNSEINNLTSYFNILQNIKLHRGHIGLMLEGYANANIINNIHLYNVGGEEVGGGIYFKSIGNKVPIENSIHSVFHHYSQDARTITIDCDTMYNKLTNILSEQGGTKARCVFVTDNGKNSNNNTLIISANVNMGNNFVGDFKQKNIILGTKEMDLASLNCIDINATNIKLKNLSFTKKKSATYKNINPITENQKVKLLSISQSGTQNMQGVLLSIKLLARSGTNSSALIKTGEQKCEIKQTANTPPSATVLNEIGYKMVWEGNDLFVTAPNNGTNTNRGEIYFDVDMFGYIEWSGITIDSNFIEI